MTVRLREVEPGDDEHVVVRVDDRWGGRSMAPMLPRLFFDHFHLDLTDPSLPH